MNSYQIRRVQSSNDLKNFLELPQKIYRGSGHYIQPLNQHLKMMLGSIDEPDKHLFLAQIDDRKAGDKTIAEQTVARLAIKKHNHQTPDGAQEIVHFGFFECHPKHQAAARILFQEAHSIYPNLAMRGPYNFRMEDPYIGTLVEGFAEDPYIFLSYNPEFYDQALQAAGLEKAIDLLTYKIDVTACPKTIIKIAERSRRRSGVKTRWLDAKNLKKEVRIIADLFNEALSDNWGFEEITDDQLDEMYMIFKYFIDPRLVVFLQKEIDGKMTDIGCAIMLPNLNHFLKPQQGRLSISLLYNLLFKKKQYNSARAYAMGVKKQFQGSGAVCQIIEALYARSLELGLNEVEISWVLENNRPMTEISKSMGGVHNKTYRVYDKKPITSPSFNS